MNPSGTERTPNFPGNRGAPYMPGPPTSSSFVPSVPVTASLASGNSQAPTSFSSNVIPQGGSQPPPAFVPPGSLIGKPTATYRANLPVNFNGPPGPPPNPVTTPAAYQQVQVPKFPSPSQPATPLQSPHIGPPPVSSTGIFGPPPQVSQGTPINNVAPLLRPSSFSSGSSRPPVQGYAGLQPSGSMPLPSTGPQYPVNRQVSAPPVQAVATPHVPLHAPYQTVPHFGGATALPTGPPTAFGSRNQPQFPSTGPPIVGNIHSLVEDFQSLSVGSATGSLNPGFDVEVLPRPLDCDEESTNILDSYPMNCHPRFFRLTTYALPTSQSLLSRWHLPLGIVVHPLAEVPDGEEVPIINFGTAGIVRCRRCRAYINPYTTFTDAGRKWRCNLCTMLNDVPGEYFCALDANGRRTDADQRHELSKGTVEFVAPTEYMVRPPMPPTYFFLIDVSAVAVQRGLLEVVARTIKSCLSDLPGFPRTQIGFITFDSTLHFHNLKSSLAQPQMMIVSDLEDVFLPLPDDLLVNLIDSRHVVEAFLDSLPTMFQSNANIDSALGPAIKAAYMVMSQIGGKLLIFQSTLPSLGIGHLRLRGDDARIYGSDREHTLRTPEDPFYKQMAADFTKNQIGVDIFAFADKYSDIASLGSLAKYTGGQVYYYPFFNVATHQDKLMLELARDLTRETAWEAVVRIRCSKGVRFTSYHGHFMLRSTDLLALPAIDSDKAIAVQLSLEETLLTNQVVYFQVVLLYTSSSGERRIRIHTFAVPLVADLGEMYRRADVGAIVSLMSRIAVENSLSMKLEDVRQQIFLKLVKSLKEYRNLYAVQHRLGSRLIYPESLRFLPLYVLAICKCAAIRGGFADVPLDERCASGFSMMILPIKRLLRFLYPALYRVDEILLKGLDNFDDSLKQLPLTVRCLDTAGLYIINDGFTITIWLGRMLPPELVNNIVGASLSNLHDLSKVQFREQENEISRRLARLLKFLRDKYPSSHQLVRIIRQGEQPRESFFFSSLIEDQAAGVSSYVDWVLQVHRQTQS